MGLKYMKMANKIQELGIMIYLYKIQIKHYEELLKYIIIIKISFLK